MYTLPETELMKVQTTSEDDRLGTYIIEPLSPGYGVTLGNSLRRVLFSSLQGSAVSSVRIDGVTHEFTTLPGMNEDIVGLILNLKTLRVKMLTDEPVTLRLEAKGPGEVRAKQFATNPNVEIVDPEHYLATLDKQGKLSLEITVERGRGYLPTEQKRHEQLPLGTISIDSIFTPVKKVHYEVENTRVGGMTNFDKLTIDISTDGTIHPRVALLQAAQILVEHFGIVADIQKADASETAQTSVTGSSDEEVTDAVVAPKTRKKKVALVVDEAIEKPVKKTKKTK